ncbi:MAG: serine/threonine-protein kinase [Victivallaceae bacterium]
MQQFCEKCARYTETVSGEVGGKFCSLCGGFNAGGRIAPETVIGGFKIILELGRGSNGIVYLARQLSLERDVALKILSDERARDEGFVDDFFREARAAAALNHPAIVQGYDAGLTEDGIYFFAMELIDGETMDTKIEREGALDFNEAVNIALRIAEALQYAWDRQKLTHGDIKPANIIINRHGEAKLADLGLAKSAYDESASEIMATPMYAPPELIKGDVDRANVRSDIYSFGITLYHMLAGEPPFNENDAEKVMQMHLNVDHEPLAEIFKIAGFPKDFSDFVDRLIAKDPAKRPESWNEIVDYLKNAAKLKYGHGNQFPNKPGLLRGVLNNKLVVAALVLSLMVFVAAGAAGLWWFTQLKNKGPAKSMPAVAVSKNPVAERKKKVEEIWGTVRSGIKYMRCNDAVESIKSFVAAYSPEGAMRQDAEALIKEYQQQSVIQAEKKAAQDAAKAAAAEEIKSLDAALSVEKIKGCDAQAMFETACLVQDFLNKFKTGGFPEGCVTAEQEKRYADMLAGLNASADELRAAARKKRQNYISTAMKNYIESNKRNIVENERRFNVLKEYDEYFAGLNEFMELTPDKQNSIFFKKVADPNVRNVAQPLRPRLKFIGDNLPEENSPMPVFLNRSERFAGKEIPWPLDESGKKYAFSSIDNVSMHLVNKLTEGAFERKKLLLQKLTNQQICALIENWIAKSEVKISAEEFGRLVNWLNSVREYAVLDKLLNRSGLPGVNIDSWKKCVKDLKTAAIENQAVEASAKITEIMRKNEKQAALNEISAFLKKFHSTETADRYRDYFEEYIENTVRFNPELQTSIVIDRFEKAAKAGMPADAMNIACVMVPRLAYLKCLGAEQRQLLLDCRTNSLNMFRNRADKLPDAPPLMQAAAGYFWRWYQQAGSRYSGATNEISGLYAFMDIADWSNARQALFRKKIEPDAMLDGADVGNIAAPLLYYLNVAVNRYNEDALETRISDTYERLLKNSSTGKGNSEAAVINTGWAMRSALLSRNPRAFLYGSDLALHNGQGEDDFRNVLLYLQAVLQKEDATAGNFSVLIARYNNLYKNPALENDLLWINAADKIVRNAGDAGVALQALSGKKCIFPELTATLLCDAAARSLFLDRHVDVKSVLQAVEPVIGDAVIYGELWYKAALLKIVASPTVFEMEKSASKLLNDYRICAVPYYARLLNIMTAAALLNGSLNSRDANVIMRRFMDLSPLFSPVERKIPGCLASPNPGKFFIQNVDPNKVDDSSFWIGWVAAAAEISNKHIEDVPPVIDALNKASTQLFWQERLLLRYVADFAAVKQAEVK